MVAPLANGSTEAKSTQLQRIPRPTTTALNSTGDSILQRPGLVPGASRTETGGAATSRGRWRICHGLDKAHTGFDGMQSVALLPALTQTGRSAKASSLKKYQSRKSFVRSPMGYPLLNSTLELQTPSSQIFGDGGPLSFPSSSVNARTTPVQTLTALS